MSLKEQLSANSSIISEYQQNFLIPGSMKSFEKDNQIMRDIDMHAIHKLS